MGENEQMDEQQQQQTVIGREMEQYVYRMTSRSEIRRRNSSRKDAERVRQSEKHFCFLHCFLF